MSKFNRGTSFKVMRWMAFSIGCMAMLLFAWGNLPVLIGPENAAGIKLAIDHAVGPSFSSAPLPDSKFLPKVSIVVDVESAKKSPSELRGDLKQDGKVYPIKFVTEQLNASANSFFSVFKVRLRSDESYQEMQEFEIIPPVTESQLSEWIKREVARHMGFNELGYFSPAYLEANGKQIGLRYISATPQLGSLDFSRVPYLKLFCRVSPQTLEAERKLSGAAKSKIPVRPDAEWRIIAPTLGEAVSGPEFSRMKNLGQKPALTAAESEELMRLVDLEYFARFAAIQSLVDGISVDDLSTPASFRFEEISGRIRPSFQLCDSAGLIPQTDEWFQALMKKLNSQSDFIDAYNQALERLSSGVVQEELFRPLQRMIQEHMVPGVFATPFRYALNTGNQLNYVYGSSAVAEVKEVFDRFAMAGSISATPSSQMRASLNSKANKIIESDRLVLTGNRELLEDLTIKPGQTLVLESGANIKMAPGVSILISGGVAEFRGTTERPVLISAAKPAPWGSIILSNQARATINNTIITGGSEAYREYVRYEGAIAAHNARVSIANSKIDGLASFNNSRVEISDSTFTNLIPQMFLSRGAQVSVKNVIHVQETPRHTGALLEQTPHGVPHTEREFKYTIHADWKSQELLQTAENLQRYLGGVLSDRSKWKAPQFSTNGSLYRPDEKVGEFAYADIYIDTEDYLNYKHDISYRFRYRFENQASFNNYVHNPGNPTFWPYRLEYQGKIGRGHPAPGFSEVYEARFEFRKQSLPFSEDYLAPWSPWDVETYLPYMLSGAYQNITTVSGAEVQRFLAEKTGRSEFTFKPRVLVVTERLRQHLNITTEWGSGPNPDQSNIITLDRSEVFDAEEFLQYLKHNKYGQVAGTAPQSLGVMTEMEIEFERNVSRELDKRLKQARQQNNEPEVSRLSQARQAFIDDLSTLRAEIVEFFNKQNVSVSPGDQSKYLQSYDIWKEGMQGRSSAIKPGLRADRLTLTNEAGQGEMVELLQLLHSRQSERGQKFVLSADQTLVVSSEDWQNSSHDRLGQGRDVQTAGYMKSVNGQSAITITNRSGDYCPSLESLKRVKEYIEQRSNLEVTLSEQTNEKCNLQHVFSMNTLSR